MTDQSSLQAHTYDARIFYWHWPASFRMTQVILFSSTRSLAHLKSHVTVAGLFLEHGVTDQFVKASYTLGTISPMFWDAHAIRCPFLGITVNKVLQYYSSPCRSRVSGFGAVSHISVNRVTWTLGTLGSATRPDKEHSYGSCNWPTATWTQLHPTYLTIGLLICNVWFQTFNLYRSFGVKIHQTYFIF